MHTNDVFAWFDLPDGRGRFGGAVRGSDERGHETFGVEVDAEPFYGEIVKIFSGNAMHLQVTSFGYRNRDDVGPSVANLRQAFTVDEARRIENVVRELVVYVDGFDPEIKPTPLNIFEDEIFTGDVVFASGWILIET